MRPCPYAVPPRSPFRCAVERTDTRFCLLYLSAMDNQPHISHMERLHEGVVIEFDDGTTALYSAALLYQMAAHAENIDSPDPDEEEVSGPDSPRF